MGVNALEVLVRQLLLRSDDAIKVAFLHFEGRWRRIVGLKESADQGMRIGSVGNDG